MTIEVGSKLEGKVTGITHFGAFVELKPGVTGLVHISEIADSYVKDVSDHLKVHDIITVKVLSVDPGGKIGLSIRQAVDKPVAPRTPGTDRPFPRDRADGGQDRRFRQRGGGGQRTSFEDKVSRFLKDSEERMTSLRKNTEGKRGGRGARRY